MTVQDSLSADKTTMFSFFLSLFNNLKVLSLSRYTLFDTIFVTDLKYSWKFSFESSLIKGSNFDDKASNSTARFCLMCLKLWCKPYFKPLTSNSCEERLTTGIL